MIVTLAHLRTVPNSGKQPGYCSSGSRQWFAAHGLDWDQFRHNGIDAEVLLATGDALAVAVVRHAESVEAACGQ
ncbi:hypothetical protein NB688_000592 [Xanthomonas sacchari]|uniref:Uncharacterized protein n=1 Tax=Xanthomonas sacchari TaxID=56458 RepID=A0ABT3DTE8_9XANT|nr:hypothetical protein [Xanthomonas sacchari]MCW0398778.1 hypothetical protein [Xanthomonas sacchari]MCW0418426.1 hypothetical protein [Xanthomonas sacchari]UYK72511.1 hypothetical protein NG828_20380 [Xanthomonas sacchari]